MKKEYVLQNLACAHCSSEIENEINKIDGIKASINFVTKTLSITIDDNKDANKITDKINWIVHSHEPSIIIKEKNKSFGSSGDNDIEYNQKKDIIRFCISAVIFICGIVLKLPNKTEFVIFFISYIISGGAVILKALKNIVRGKVFDENFLMGIATIGAFSVGQFAEGAAVMLFYQIGEIFQQRAVNSSKKSISALMDIKPDYANIEKDGELLRVPIEEVGIGEVITIKPGEKVPLDGIVVSGSSNVDTSALTGESMPREISTKDEILSGFININGVLTVKVIKEFGESTVSKIIEMVENAANRKARTENFITKFAKVYTPAVVIGAVLTALLPPLFIPGAQFAEWIYRALIFLVISCPCALVISIPLSFFAGIGAASKNGILIKGSNYLEALYKADTIVFDKTGTLTKGVFEVVSIMPQNGYCDKEVLEYAAYAESYSNHPVAQSIIKAYGKEIDKSKVISYEEITGKGVIANVEGMRIIAGNYKLFNNENISYIKNDMEGTIIYVALNNEFIASIVVFDQIKKDSYGLAKKLKNMGIIKTIILTGDNKDTAEKVGKILDIDKVYAELLPAEKVEVIEKLTEQKTIDKKIVFAGDGINDAPALARADISIAMGGLGSDAAIEAADIVIMTDEPSKIVKALNIAKKTKKIIWQNIVFALGIKAAFLFLGAMGIASMWEAVFADVGVALIAILNSMRTLRA